MKAKLHPNADPDQKTYYKSVEDWQAEAKRRFGDVRDTKFVCPVCGHIATPRDWVRHGASQGEIGFSCVGRHIDGSREAFSAKGEGPCTYAGGGLFRLNPIDVRMEEGVRQSFFAFARSE